MSRSLKTRLAVFCICFATTVSAIGCGEERALMEVELELPKTGGQGTRVWAFVEVQSEADGDFLWPEGNGVQQQLRTTAATILFGVPATEDTGMRMRVRFCLESGCTDPADAVGMAPQVGYVIERSHYLLETTLFRRSIDAIPPNAESKVVRIGKCEIGGCWSGDLISWCTEDGFHACE